MQQLVWKYCTTLPPNSIKSTYSQQLWEESCAELLHYSKASTEEAGVVHGNLLWSNTFRVSFLHQVEKLLRSSCQAVLDRTKRLFLQTLRSEGIIVDPITLIVDYKDASHSVDKTSSIDFLPTSSSTLYVLADRIQHEFEDSIFSLLDDVVSPMKDGGDPQSSLALAKALKVQCCHLVGQFFVFLRSIGESCRDALIKRGFLSSDLQNLNRRLDSKTSTCADSLVPIIKKCCSSRITSSVYKYHHAGINSNVSKKRMTALDVSIASGLLLLGRVAWLFRIRSSFLEYALELNASDSKTSIAFELNSEDQFRSAFEIADTDGDGVLTYLEALEAIQALAVSDNSSFNNNKETNEETNMSEDAAIMYGLSASLTPSISYPEFVLICGSQLLTSSVFHPLNRVSEIIDNIIVFAHVVWAVCTVQSVGTSLLDDVGKELCFDLLNETNRKKQSTEKPFKISWHSKSVDLDEDSDRMLVPSSCSSFLSKFLFSINNSLMIASVSIDTMQRVPTGTTSDGSLLVQLDGNDAMLCRIVSKIVSELVVQEVHYMFDLFLSRVSQSSDVSDIVEESSLQVIFDLLVCSSITIEKQKLPLGSVSKWRQHVDPITAEIIIPLVEQSARDFAQSILLIYPCLQFLPTKAVDVHQESPKSLGGDSSLSAIFPQHLNIIRFRSLPLAICTTSSNVGQASDKQKVNTKNKSSTQSNDSKSTTASNSGNWW